MFCYRRQCLYIRRSRSVKHNAVPHRYADVCVVTKCTIVPTRVLISTDETLRPCPSLKSSSVENCSLLRRDVALLASWLATFFGGACWFRLQDGPRRHILLGLLWTGGSTLFWDVGMLLLIRTASYIGRLAMTNIAAKISRVRSLERLLIR